MFTASDEETKRWWPMDFRLVHRVTFGPELIMELVVTNTGTGPMRFEEALHSYHRVGRIGDVRVRGLHGVDYLDKPDSSRQKTQRGDIVFSSETDRVFMETPGAVEMVDEALGRRLRITKRQSLATVVWNPWIEKAHALADLGDDEWTRFVCIETANVAGCAVDLAPGQQHIMAAVVSLAPL
jgi:glucose-6-phosphate 1-epimerase